MQLLRSLLLSAARHSFSFSAQHVPSVNNQIAVALSRFRWQDFEQLGPDSQPHPTWISPIFWRPWPLRLRPAMPFLLDPRPGPVYLSFVCFCPNKVYFLLSSAGEVGFSSSSRLPITDDLMLVIWRSLDLHLPDHCMFWPACSLGYFGFLHASEFTVPNWSSFSSSLHLGVQDIAVDSLQLHLACLSGSRALRLIHLGRAVPFTLCSLCLNDLPCAHVRCPWQPVFVAK